jgi:pimeloyl-ACP methyl ester carboxylesterase
VGGPAAVIARSVVLPDHELPPEDVEILGSGPDAVILRATPESLAPGRYGIWFDGLSGHARVGAVLDHDTPAGTVTRELLGVDSGRLRAGGGRWNQYFYAGTPSSALGLGYDDVTVEGPVGPLPAWFVPPSPQVRRRGTWAVLVHGRGGTREETLRALPLLHRLGFPSLVTAYRNDADALAVPRGRYHLGVAEWEDVEAAVVHALATGADDVVMFGWSMGGAITMQLLDRSWVAVRVRAAVLDAPVLDWRDVLDHHARLNRVPIPLARLSQRLLGHVHGRRLVALEAPVDLARLDWVSRADELDVPLLILHSDDDEFVPSGPSRRLAQARPDLVRLVSSRDALHTREWNVDPAAWESAVARFLLAL